MLEIRKNVTVRVVKHTLKNSLPREVVDAPSLEVFKDRSDGTLNSLEGVPCVWQGVVGTR